MISTSAALKTRRRTLKKDFKKFEFFRPVPTLLRDELSKRV